MPDNKFANYLASNYLNDKDGIDESLMAGGPSVVGQTPAQPEQSAVNSHEDPLFTAIAGDSKTFIGGIPKETWDKLSPEQKDRLVRGTETDRRIAGYIGAGIGGGLGAAAAIPIALANPYVGAVAGGAFGGAGGALGYNTGYDLLDKNTPPREISRDTLRDQYEFAKEHD